MQPEEATVSNLSDDTRNNVRWFSGVPKNTGLDLGVIAQLGLGRTRSIGYGAEVRTRRRQVLRHRIRKQLPNYFLTESRQAGDAPVTSDALADRVAACVALLERSDERKTGLQFSPNVYAISDMLEGRKTDFVAISSSSVDPACFLGGWLKEAYLWDYDLPSYSQRAGDTNGYYVLSKVKASDRDAMRKVLSKLPGCDTLDDAEVAAVLLEIAGRGIPTIRGLSGDDSGSTGDLGAFVASRLLQDRFRKGVGLNSLLPVIDGAGADREIALVIPVDTFRGYLEDLRRAYFPRKGRPDPCAPRPHCRRHNLVWR